MSVQLRRHAICTLLLLLCLSPFLQAQHGHGDHGSEGMPDGYESPIKLFRSALGEHNWQITTSDTLAQAYFKQGLQWKYAFAVNEAARSFREARTIDTLCAPCYWGEAWALGSYLNEPMNEAKAPMALHAIRKAVELAPQHANATEQALIQALSQRYIENFVPDERGAQDTAYAEAMARVYEQFPDQHEVATVYAEALFLLEPRRGTRDIEDPDVKKIHRILEKVLDENLQHPGACHLYIHATESTERPDLGESCAAFISSAIPGASHINHMPSHTYNEVGRWGESVRANLEAWHTDQKAKID